MSDQAKTDSSREIWSSPDDMKLRHIRITKAETITICFSGLCVTMPLYDLFKLAVGDVEDRHEAAKS